MGQEEEEDIENSRLISEQSSSMSDLSNSMFANITALKKKYI